VSEVEVKKLEVLAAELVKRYEGYCVLPTIELFRGEDDGRNKTYEYTRKRGLPLPRTKEVLMKQYAVGYAEPLSYGGGAAYKTEVDGVYATDEGILVQFHKVVSNRYGPVKDYGWYVCLTSLILGAKREVISEIISAVKSDLEDWERELNKEIARKAGVRSYRVEKPLSGYIIAFCPQCGTILRPACREERTLFFVHEHRPVFIVLEWGGRERTVKCSVQDQSLVDQSLVEIVEMLWHDGGARAIERIVGLWLRFRKKEYEEEAMRAFFVTLQNVP
jgi:hypothetical protein